jgi:monofunctional biosynthetic peptidoglycan transglycosylase
MVAKYLAAKNLAANMSTAPRAQRSRTVRLLRAGVGVLAVLLVAPYVLAPLYRYGHPISTLMLGRWLTGAAVTRQWVDLGAVAPPLIRAVIVAEDARFCSHGGIDWSALSEAIEDAQDGEAGGGGSTITQQVAKNLFLWPGRSYVRKALELPLALWIDRVLPKQRILEIYLNIAEWGPDGQFGVEAGARHAFGRGAGTLGPRDSALLAAVLPNPVTRSAARPGPAVSRRAGIYLSRAAAGQVATACLGRGF